MRIANHWQIIAVLMLFIGCKDEWTSDRSSRPSDEDRSVPGYLGEVERIVSYDDSVWIEIGNTRVHFESNTTSLEKTKVRLVRWEAPPLADEFVAQLGSPAGDVIEVSVTDPDNSELLSVEQMLRPYAFEQTNSMTNDATSLGFTIVTDPNTDQQKAFYVGSDFVNFESLSLGMLDSKFKIATMLKATHAVLWLSLPPPESDGGSIINTFGGNTDNPFISRLLEPKTLNCIGVSADRVVADWTNPGGSAAKMKLIYSTDQIAVNTARGCSVSAGIVAIESITLGTQPRALSGLSAGTSYHIRVCSVDGDGNVSPGVTCAPRTKNNSEPELHVVSMRGTNLSTAQLIYDRKSESGWTHEALAFSLSDQVTTFASMGLNSLNEPSIAFYDSNSNLTIAKRKNSLWTSEIVRSYATAYEMDSMTIGNYSGDDPRIMTTFVTGTQASENTPQLSKRASGAWETLSWSNNGFYIVGGDSLVVDQSNQGNLIVLFMPSGTEYDASSLLHFHESNGIWSAGQTISSPACTLIAAHPVGRHIGATMDKNGKLHIAYACNISGTGNATVLYSTNKSGNWSHSVVRQFSGATFPSIWAGLSIAVSKAGQVQILIKDRPIATTDQLIMATLDIGQSTFQETVLSEILNNAGYVYSAFIRHDADDKTHVVHDQFISSTSKFIHLSNRSGSWVSEQFFSANVRYFITGFEISNQKTRHHRVEN